MNYDDEHWIKVYTRDTAGWLASSWQARGLALEIARKLPKKTGELSLGRRGLEALAGLLRAPWSEIEPFVNELIADGRLEYDADRQVICDPGHAARQTAATSPAERKRRQRELEAANDIESRDVTAGHATSRAVTPSHEEKRREEKREEEKRNTPLPPKGAGAADEVHTHYVETLKVIRPKRRPPKLSPKDRKRIGEHLASGLTVDDLKRAIDGLMLSPHHLGDNDRHTEYLELEYALRKPTQMAALVPDEPLPRAPPAVAEPGVPPPPGALEAIEKFIAETGT